MSLPFPAPTTLIVRLRERCQALSVDSRVEWRALGAPTASVHGTDRLCDVAARLTGPDTAVWLILPGEDVVLDTLRLPATSARQAHAAAPFVIEEYLLDPLEAMHVVCGEWQANQPLVVAAIAHAALQHVLHTCRALGIHAAHAYIDHQLLSLSRAEPTLYADSDRAIVALAAQESFCAPTAYLHDWLLRCATEAAAIVRYGAPSEPAPGTGNTRHAATLQPNPWRDAGPAEFLSLIECSQGTTALDLLQGPYTPRARHRAARRAARAFAGAALGALLCLCGINVAIGTVLQQRGERAHRDAEQLYRRYYPEDTRIIDVRRQLDAHLRGAQRAALGLPFLRVLENTMGILAPFHQDGRLALESLDFDESRARFGFSASGIDVAVLETLRAALAEQAIPVRLMNVTRNEGRYLGRFEISDDTAH